ncbi:MAG: hypothetical protein DRI57_01065 [Deltaproteobacteria bacterium]|nr:MAG: hypothetical protein DRI57_01065 [Deltaproteobacteria bacterium]
MYPSDSEKECDVYRIFCQCSVRFALPGQNSDPGSDSGHVIRMLTEHCLWKLAALSEIMKSHPIEKIPTDSCPRTRRERDSTACGYLFDLLNLGECF